MPEFVIDCAMDLLLPGCTVPKLKEVGLAIIAPVPVLRPVPDKAIDIATLPEPCRLVKVKFKESIALLLPAFCGLNETCNETLCPALTVAGRDNPLTEYPLLVRAIVESVHDWDPVLLMTTT